MSVWNLTTLEGEVKILLEKEAFLCYGQVLTVCFEDLSLVKETHE